MAKGKFQQPRGGAAVKKKKQKNKLRPVLFTAAGILVGVFAVFLVSGLILQGGSRIYPNVRVAGVDVGGMSPRQAKQTVEDSLTEAYLSQPLEVQLPDRILTFDPSKTKMEVNAQLAIDEAMAFGREDGPFRAVISYFECRKHIQDILLDSALQLDTTYIQSLIAMTAADVKTLPVHSSMGLNQAMTEVKVQVGTSGRELDAEGLYQAVYESLQRGDFAPLQWDYTVVPYTSVDMDRLQERLLEQITDARYDPEAHAIIDGVSGYTFDVEAAKASLEEAREGITLYFPLEEVEPELTKGKLTNQMFGEVLETRSSVYVNNPKRTENLRLACEAINGTIINPGEVFSFNDTVGERTEEKGYQPATIYGGEGESVDGVGGGVCQVASTIYYAALYLDLPTVQREPHMYVVTYVPAGCDATIFWSSKLDYKFKNNRENPIKIQANIDNGKCNITFWGVKEGDTRVELSQPVYLETWNDPDEEKVDETKPIGYRELDQSAYQGAKVVVTKKVLDKDGTVLREEKLHSTYKSRPNIYIVGPSEEQPPEEQLPEDQQGPEEISPDDTTENGNEGTFLPEDEDPYDDWS